MVTNTAADAAANHAVVDLIQNVDAGGNSYGGTISGDLSLIHISAAQQQRKDGFHDQ